MKTNTPTTPKTVRRNVSFRRRSRPSPDGRQTQNTPRETTKYQLAETISKNATPAEITRNHIKPNPNKTNTITPLTSTKNCRQPSKKFIGRNERKTNNVAKDMHHKQKQRRPSECEERSSPPQARAAWQMHQQHEQEAWLSQKTAACADMCVSAIFLAGAFFVTFFSLLKRK